MKYFEEVKGDKTCKIGDYSVRIGGVRLGKETNGKHVNSQIIFFADRDKIVCHLYNTTQLILVNGVGHQKFVEIFLKPFLQAKINEQIEGVEEYNDEVVSKLGPKTVKRSVIKVKKSNLYSCISCDYTFKSTIALKRHRKNEHILGLESSKEIKQSTRNNSLAENLMIEDMTISDLDDKTKIETLHEEQLKYTCHECNFTTLNKKEIDNHIANTHTEQKNEEVAFICTICGHEFEEVENYLSKTARPQKTCFSKF